MIRQLLARGLGVLPAHLSGRLVGRYLGHDGGAAVARGLDQGDGNLGLTGLSVVTCNVALVSGKRLASCLGDAALEAY